MALIRENKIFRKKSIDSHVLIFNRELRSAVLVVTFSGSGSGSVILEFLYHFNLISSYFDKLFIFNRELALAVLVVTFSGSGSGSIILDFFVILR